MKLDELRALAAVEYIGVLFTDLVKAGRGHLARDLIEHADAFDTAREFSGMGEFFAAELEAIVQVLGDLGVRMTVAETQALLAAATRQREHVEKELEVLVRVEALEGAKPAA